MSDKKLEELENILVNAIDRAKQNCADAQPSGGRISFLSMLLLAAMGLFISGFITANTQEPYSDFVVDDQKLIEHWPAKKTMTVPSSFPELPDIEIIYDPSLAYSTS